METATISVLRQLPRNIRIMVAVSRAAMMLSCTTPDDAARTNSDWSKSNSIFRPWGPRPGSVGSRSLTWRTMSSVRGAAVFEDRDQGPAVAVAADHRVLRR